ncbi:MAG: ARMT1-like domain-containing protein [bacterium]|nr:ARMT1-like domain-containing protein [bacterium]
MKAQNVCIPCILDDLVGAARDLDLSPEMSRQVIREALDFLAKNYDGARPPSFYITGVHRILKKVTGILVPFADIRERANHAGVKLADKVRTELKSVPEKERFHRLVRLAVAGNELDFRTVGTGYRVTETALELRLREAVSRSLAVDEIGKIHQAARKAKNILFIHDNVGEIALDRLLIEELKRMGARVASVLRGGPITSDATVEDGKTVGLDQVARVIEAGPDTLGISFEEMSSDLKKALAGADLIFSKGQANYYVLSEHRREIPAPIAYLLRTKCDLAASEFGQQGKVSIAALR